MQAKTRELLQQAMGHLQAGRLAQAEALCRQVLAAEPRAADALHLIGVAALWSKRYEEAAGWIGKAVEVRPGDAGYLLNLAIALSKLDRSSESLACLEKCVAIEPDFPEALNNMGVILKGQGRLDEAIAVCAKAVRLRPGFVQAQMNLANSLRDAGRLDEAMAAYRQALALDKNDADVYTNYGSALYYAGEIDEALEAYGKSLAIRPGDPQTHSNRGMALLLKGELAEGFKEYQWRSQERKDEAQRRAFLERLWDGSPLNGRTLLVQAEQGLGDTLQFSRFVPAVHRQNGRVICECQRPLLELLRESMPEVEWVTAGQGPGEFDVHFPLMSLPGVLGFSLAEVGTRGPYLRADAERVAMWGGRFAGESRRKVGVVWAGSRKHLNDRHRSLPVKLLGAIAAAENVRVYSLQVGATPADAAEIAEMGVVDVTAELKDFQDTAALVMNLDLVVTVDTAVAHLAGALGKMVWVMLPYNRDWRWMLGREDSPWYPTLRLFRQTQRGEWASVVARVEEELRGLVASSR